MNAQKPDVKTILTDSRGLRCRARWLEAVLRDVEQGEPDLTNADKVKIRQCLDKFFEDYVSTQGELPLMSPDYLVLCYTYLSQFYRMPELEEDIKAHARIGDKMIQRMKREPGTRYLGSKKH